MTSIYCCLCGFENKSTNKCCDKCNEILYNPNNIKTNNKINNVQELFTDNHHRKLNDFILTLDSYEIIIQNIIEIGENKIIYKKNMTTLERIKAITESYATVITKDVGNNYGEYAYNIICIDENFDSSIQIATLLHELTHHLFNEILKQILMYIWNSKSSYTLEAFIQTVTSLPAVLLTSEYCASKTEEKYLPEKYVSFSSFNHICEDINYDKTTILNSLIIGKGISESIIRILSAFIDYDLELKIKEEFDKNKTSEIYNPICIEDSSINSTLLRNIYLTKMLLESYEILNNKQYLQLINKNITLFEKSYKSQK